MNANDRAAFNREQRALDARDTDDDNPTLTEVLLATARTRCQSNPWPELHPDDCAWCAHVLAVRGPL